ncbi:MAG: hypothetical protein EHM41_15235 [Chloroflexi bacterium]|nr:MAG: hypothetical protein EHM41_15235 [Chloroflexota bacterium]
MYNRNLLIRNMWILMGWLALVPVLIIACRLSGTINLPLTGIDPTPMYIPPTSATTPFVVVAAAEQAEFAQPAPTVESIELRATPTPSCTNSLRFIEDLSIPDGTVVTPGTSLDKRWNLENNGTCNWDKDYRVKLVGGPDMGVQAEQALYPARSGTQAMIRMVFVAPQEPGTYRSAWQAYDENGQPFGDPFYIEIVVQNP